MRTESPPNADFLFYYNGSNVMVEPRNAAATQYLDTTLEHDALAWRNGAAIVETSAVIPLTHKLIVAGFKIVGERRLVESGPRLYLHDGKWGLYSCGPDGVRVIPEKLSGLILKGAGKPN
jgi:hypothetical protein